MILAASVKYSISVVSWWLSDHLYDIHGFRFCFAIYLICLYAHVCLGISHTVVRPHCATALLLLRHTSPPHTIYHQILLLHTNHSQPHDLCVFDLAFRCLQTVQLHSWTTYCVSLSTELQTQCC